MTRTILALAASMMMSLSCIASPNANEKVTVDTKFTAISVANNIDVYYTTGKNVSVKIEAPKNVISNVKADVKSNTLVIYTQGDVKLTDKDKIKVSVTAPAVNSFTAVDNAEITCQSAISVDGFTLSLKNNAEFKAPALIADKIAVNAADNSEVKINQGIMAGNIAISLSGNAEFKTTDINANEVALNANDNSEIKLTNCGFERMTAMTGNNAEIKLTGKCSVVSYTATDNSHIIADELLANGGIANASGKAMISTNVVSLQQTLDGETASIKNLR